MLARLIRGRDYFTDNKKLRVYIRESLPPNINTFGDLALPLFVTISHLVSNALYVYGDDPTAQVIEAVILSAAVSGRFPAAACGRRVVYGWWRSLELAGVAGD
ncbi:MAG: hypothetical protein HC853_09235 [Anaerolineae bacterium]|nr:hypothetical protein [Anaerolineae bacterium]